MQGQSHGVIERAASHGGLQHFHRARGLVATEHRKSGGDGADGDHGAGQPCQQHLRCFREGPKHVCPVAGEWLTAQDIVDHHLGCGGRHQAADGGHGEGDQGEADASAVGMRQAKERAEQRGERSGAASTFFLSMPRDRDVLPLGLGSGGFEAL